MNSFEHVTSYNAIVAAINNGYTVYWKTLLYTVYVQSGKLNTHCSANDWCIGLSVSEYADCFIIV